MFSNYVFANILKKSFSIPYNIISMSYNDIKKTDQGTPHSHHCTEIMIAIDGEGTLTVNGQNYPLNGRSLYVVNPTTEHTESTKTSLRYYVFKFENYIPYNQTLFTPVNIYDMPHDKRELLLNYCNIIRQELLSPSSYTTETVTSLLTCVYFFCTDFLKRNDTYIQHKMINNKISSRVQTVINYLQSHYQEDIVISEIATQFSFSHNNLIRVFKKETGLSPRDYLIKIRLESATHLLKNTDYAILHIAFHTGFTSSAFFSKTFKQKYGMTPSQYRKVHKQKI